MTDIALTYKPLPASFGIIDIALEGTDLKSGDALRTAVMLSLFTNRRAADDDVLPFGMTDPQGWWGDEFSDYDDDLTGSRLYLLAQAKQTNETLNQAKEYCQEALQWFVNDGIASQIAVEAQWVRMSVLGIQVQMSHPDGSNSRFDFLWNDLEAEAESLVKPAPQVLPFLVTDTGKAITTHDGFLIAVS